MTEQLAMERYIEYLEAGLQMHPPFKGYGMKLIQFAMEEPEMFRIVFLQPGSGSYEDFMEERLQIHRILPVVEESLQLNHEDARWLLKSISCYALGIGTLLANGCCTMTPEEIGINLSNIFRGMMMQLKSPTDERIRIMPQEHDVKLGSLEEYIKGKKNVILGYGPEKEMYQVRLDAILYFEAVGENVFAYTKSNVYEIKQRLYQIESYVQDFSFVRAAKALLVNTKKIASIAPEEGGRSRIQLLNGETVIASRAYAKQVIEKMKDPVR